MKIKIYKSQTNFMKFENYEMQLKNIPKILSKQNHN